MLTGDENARMTNGSDVLGARHHSHKKMLSCEEVAPLHFTPWLVLLGLFIGVTAHRVWRASRFVEFRTIVGKPAEVRRSISISD